MTLGANYHYFDLDNDIIGMKRGETKSLSKTLPADSPKQDLAGKTVRLVLTLKTLKRRDLPAIDDDLAQDVSEKYTTLSDLKADITRRLEAQRDAALRNVKAGALMAALVKRNPIDLPRSMIRVQAESQWRQMSAMFGQVSSADSDNALKNLKAEMFPNIEKSAVYKLKQSLIIQELAKDAHIECTPSDFDAEYERIAAVEDVPVERVKESFADSEEKSHLERLISERKLFDSLFARIRTEPGKTMTLSQLFEESRKEGPDEPEDSAALEAEKKSEEKAAKKPTAKSDEPAKTE
jgi:trigger factor